MDAHAYDIGAAIVSPAKRKAKRHKERSATNQAERSEQEDADSDTDNSLANAIVELSDDAELYVENSTWYTPSEVVKYVHEIFRACGFNKPYIQLDPCSDRHNRTRAKKFYTTQNSGLTNDWLAATVYANPPFEQCEEWVNKCIAELDAGHLECAIMLLPVRYNRPYWHALVTRGFVHAVPATQLTFEQWTETGYEAGPGPYREVTVLFCITDNKKHAKTFWDTMERHRWKSYKTISSYS